MSDAWPPGLQEAFGDYERASGADDLAELDRLSAPGPGTMHGDADGLLVGHEAIAEFRGDRGGAPARRLVATEVRVLDATHALVVAETELDRGGRGWQTQVWVRLDDGVGGAGGLRLGPRPGARHQGLARGRRPAAARRPGRAGG